MVVHPQSGLPDRDEDPRQRRLCLDRAYDVTRPYSVNGRNQYTAAGAVTFTYDANGNLTSDGSTNFTCDVENRLVSASGARTALLLYDPRGRLFQSSGGTAGITQFLYDGNALVAEYDAAGALQRRCGHWVGADVPVAGGIRRRRSRARS